MILIQAILIIAFVVLLMRFLTDPAGSQMKAWKKIFGMLFAFAAIFAVLFPDMLNRAANLVGVGRGADLLLYLLTLSFIFVVINNYISNRYEQRRFVKLTRNIAIIEADNRYKFRG